MWKWKGICNMLTYCMIEKTDEYIKYAYYPEDKREKVGYLIFDVKTKNIKEIIESDDDYLIISTVEEQNRLRNSLNEMRRENGRKELTEEEWPLAIEDIKFFAYASKAIDKISLAVGNSNCFPNEGSVVWY